MTNPTFDPIVKPGCLYGYFRANPEGRNRDDYMRERERIPDHYRDRHARLAVMDAQGLGAVRLFPTLGVLYEESLKQDPDAVAIAFRAFNRWVDEDWGLNWKNRIFVAPEGLVEPLDYSADLQGFKPEGQQKILRDNTVGLTELAPV